MSNQKDEQNDLHTVKGPDLTDETHMRKEPDKQKHGIFRDFIVPIVCALLIVLLVRHFIVGMYYIPSGSMIPTLNINNQVVVTKFTYRFEEPKRGDIVVFKYPVNEKEGLHEEDYVKRLIGKPGETLEIKNNQVYINGEPIQEPYVASDTNMPDFGPVTIPDHQYFMMGDNRNHSNDSRYWGYVDRKYFIGKAQLIYWPISDWRVLS